MGWSWDAASAAAGAVGAHHGSFTGRPSVLPPEEWEHLQDAATDWLSRAFQASPIITLDRSLDSWTIPLAGLTAVADWIASDASRFPYQKEVGLPLPSFLEARRKAIVALDDIGWSSEGMTAPGGRTIEELFPWLREPRALQVVVPQLARSADGPTLIIVEAPTGAGKTEAALAAAEELMARTGAAGLYYALPTQATSNQMFGRLRDMLEARNGGVAQTNLHLLHGLAALNSTYADLSPSSVNGPEGSNDSVVADAWFKTPKQGLLAPYALGTVDQAMLAALRVRHAFVRMFGLAGKVVVIDEVHAYDTFMQTIIARLLEWLHALGSSVVLLSASLPRSLRQQLVNSWSRHAQAVVDTGPSQVTAIAADSTKMVPIPSPGARQIRLTELPNEATEVARWLHEQLQGGGCGAWICNTVARAQAAYIAARDAGFLAPDLLLFHAAYPTGDRLAREKKVLGLYSKGGARPARGLVIATQVLEQSLDVDFDLMVTDLAPVDLVVQRVGRLHRHSSVRPDALAEPLLGLVMPDAESVSAGLAGIAGVYDAHVMLRSWLCLSGLRHALLPDRVREWLDSVYEPALPPPGISEGLRRLWDATLGRQTAGREAQGFRAGVQLMPAPDSGDGDGVEMVQDGLMNDDDDPRLHASIRAKTRDIDMSVNVVCLTRLACGGVALTPDSDPIDVTRGVGRPLTRRLLERAVTISGAGRARRILAETERPTAWASNAALRYHRLLIVDHNGTPESDDLPVRLDTTLGLAWANTTALEVHA